MTKSSNNSKKSSRSKKSQPIIDRVKLFWLKLNSRRLAYLERRPHRSFKRTKRRDYKRPLKLPGYIELTFMAIKTIWANRWQYFGIMVVYIVLAVALSAIMTQDGYSQIKEMVDEARDESLWNGVLAIFVLFWNIVAGQLTTVSSASGSSQQIAVVLLSLYAWLAIIWLTRVIMANKRPLVRDSLYNSGSPVIALLILVVVMMIQAFPGAIALIVYNAADQSGLLSQTVILMLAGGAMAIVVTLSLYWMTSTFLAMVIVTLPGMYPMEAIRLAGDLVVGRRIRILLRIFWILLVILLIWAVVLVPVILFDGALKSAIPAIDWLPIVPAVALGLSILSLVILTVYIYTFYRKVVDDDSAPA